MEETVIQSLLSRRSVRSYAPRPVVRELLNTVLEAGLLAPSAHDSRPWRFVVFEGAEKAVLTQRLARAFRRDMEEKGLAPEVIRERQARSAQIFGGAPILILAFRKTNLPHNPLDPSGQAEEVMAVQSAALAGGQMMQAAHALGLGTCWFAAPLFCREELAGLAGEDGWLPQYLLTLGWPDGTAPKPKDPARWDQVVSFRLEEKEGSVCL